MNILIKIFENGITDIWNSYCILSHRFPQINVLRNTSHDMEDWFLLRWAKRRQDKFWMIIPYRRNNLSFYEAGFFYISAVDPTHILFNLSSFFFKRETTIACLTSTKSQLATFKSIRIRTGERQAEFALITRWIK